ncbi:hypothetical protein C8Q74DRAFT_3499 [Fomes fomentarius]|nr:hypothetical protein C8Q74DRAFT_3499 [Fomes fomentarius]
MESFEQTASAVAQVFLLSPHNDTACINRLPNELLLMIFHSYFALFWGPKPSNIHIGHVCRRWRAILLSSPSVWTSVLSYSLFEDSQKNRECVGELLKRSSPHPVEIRLVAPLAAFWELLAPHSSRISSLSLTADEYDDVLALHNIAGWQLPGLEVLELHFMGDDAEEDDFSQLPPWEEANLPHLQELVVSTSYFTPSTALPSLRRLFLDGDCGDLGILSAALGKCSMLQMIYLDGVGSYYEISDEDRVTARTPLDLPHLSSVTCIDGEEDTYAVILPQLPVRRFTFELDDLDICFDQMVSTAPEGWHLPCFGGPGPIVNLVQIEVSLMGASAPLVPDHEPAIELSVMAYADEYNDCTFAALYDERNIAKLSLLSIFTILPNSANTLCVNVDDVPNIAPAIGETIPWDDIFAQSGSFRALVLEQSCAMLARRLAALAFIRHAATWALAHTTSAQNAADEPNATAEPETFWLSWSFTPECAESPASMMQELVVLAELLSVCPAQEGWRLGISLHSLVCPEAFVQCARTLATGEMQPETTDPSLASMYKCLERVTEVPHQVTVQCTEGKESVIMELKPRAS